MTVFHHISVMLNETIDYLNIKEDGVYVDCTLGGGVEHIFPKIIHNLKWIPYSFL